MKHITRRKFMTGAMAAGAYALLAPHSRVLGANEDIRVAIVGCGGRGGGHLKSCAGMKGVRLVALCDCDTNILESAAKRLGEKGPAVQTYTDVRKLLESKEVDAISTATPNHWHSLITVWGCQAGKDVYVEKPVSHNIFEGRQSVVASRQYSRIVQAGTQSR